MPECCDQGKCGGPECPTVAPFLPIDVPLEQGDLSLSSKTFEWYGKLLMVVTGVQVIGER